MDVTLDQKIGAIAESLAYYTYSLGKRQNLTLRGAETSELILMKRDMIDHVRNMTTLVFWWDGLLQSNIETYLIAYFKQHQQIAPRRAHMDVCVQTNVRFCKVQAYYDKQKWSSLFQQKINRGDTVELTERAMMTKKGRQFFSGQKQG